MFTATLVAFLVLWLFFALLDNSDYPQITPETRLLLLGMRAENLFVAKQLSIFVHLSRIVCRQLFAGHVVDSWPIKRKKWGAGVAQW